jgi:TfoX/Sxy family transcriptional regulator of competence genes
MAFDEQLAERVRMILADAPDLVERKMFGGIAFMVSGHMTCGVAGDDLMLRLGPEGVAEALRDPQARPMDFTGRVMSSMVFIAADGLRDQLDLERWVGKARAFVATLPPKHRS